MIDNIYMYTYSRVWLSFIYATIHLDNSSSLLIFLSSQFLYFSLPFNSFIPELVINTWKKEERLLLYRIESYFLSTTESSIQYHYNRCDEVLLMKKKLLFYTKKRDSFWHIELFIFNLFYFFVYFCFTTLYILEWFFRIQNNIPDDEM